MDNPIPDGPADRVCPLHRRPMKKVCAKCPLWVKLRGKHPQSEEEIDRWDCSLALLPLLLVENSQMQRQTGAAVESLRNETARSDVRFVQQFNRMLSKAQISHLNGHETSGLIEHDGSQN